MEKKLDKKKKRRQKWLHKYRLVVLNEDTYEEKYSLKLNRLNVFVYAGVGVIVLIALTSVLIAFTPLREYIPGYSSTSLRRTALSLEEKTDSLSRVLQINNLYLDRLKMVLNGDYSIAEMDRDSLMQYYSMDPLNIDLRPIPEDSILREQVAMDEKYNLFYQDKSVELVLVPPLNGIISDRYDPEKNHFAIDVIAEEKAPVKAVADGTVVFSDWTSQTGYVMIIEHEDGFLSAYKHNGSLFKKEGDQVKSGEAVASVGNTGEYTTGPHLHFELWKNGHSVNPENYIDF